MGWMSDKQADGDAAARRDRPAGSEWRDAAAGRSTPPSAAAFSAKLFAVGVTDQHVLVQEIDRKWNPVGAALVATPGEIKVGNIFSEGGSGRSATRTRESGSRPTARSSS